MSKITPEDLKKVQEPCKSCNLAAYGRGKGKAIYCNYPGHLAKLMGEGNPYWYELITCPKRIGKA